MLRRKYNIAIIGLGPKGLYAFADLVKSILKQKGTEINIYLFDKSNHFGTGPVYNIDQPSYLLMNYENGHIDHAAMYVCNERRINFTGFAEPNQTFSARGKVGLYLKDLYHELKEQSKGLLNVREIRDEVKNIRKTENKFVLETSEDILPQLAFDRVMITTGHNTCKPSNVNTNNYINFVYPPDQQFKPINNEDIVVLKGLGLTFIDAVLGLTEGRGGRFTSDGSKLRYIQSGNEPQKIIPFSRSGEMMLPRKRTLIPSEFELLSKLFERIFKRTDEQVDFEEDLIPALEDEFNLQGGKGSFLQAIKLEGFSIDQLIDIAEGKCNSEKLLASLIWRKFSKSFNEIYCNRGLNPLSHQRFDNYWKGKLQRISYGPPLINFKKIQAVCEVGILDMNYLKSPDLDIEKNIIITEGGASTTPFSYLIDARIPSNNLMNNPSKLYHNMLNSGLIRPAKNGQYSIGCLDIDINGYGISVEGKVIEGLTFYGIPTEGLTYNNDTLSIDHNNYTKNWISQIINDIKNEHNKINSNSSPLDRKSMVTTEHIERIS